MFRFLDQLGVEFIPTLTLGDALTFGALSVAFFGLLFNLRELARRNRQRGLENISLILQQIVNDEKTVKALRSVLYKEFRYKKEEFHKSDTEIEIDLLLGYMEIAATMYENKLVRRKEFRAIEYDFVSIYMNEEIQKYLHELTGIVDIKGTKLRSFAAFSRVGEKMAKSYLPVKAPPVQEMKAGAEAELGESIDKDDSGAGG